MFGIQALTFFGYSNHLILNLSGVQTLFSGIQNFPMVSALSHDKAFQNFNDPSVQYSDKSVIWVFGMSNKLKVYLLRL